MIIGIDGRVLQEGSGGIFVYAKNLLQALIPAAKKHRIKIFFNQCKKRRSSFVDELLSFPNVKRYQYTFPNKFLNASLKFLSWPKIDEMIGGCDVLFFPCMLYSAFSDKTKSVLVMHDLSYEFFPNCFTLKQRLWHKVMNPRKLCARSSAIIAVSGSTKRDVVNLYGIDQKKVKTVYSGIDKSFHPVVDSAAVSKVRDKYLLPQARYIIQTSTLEPRKNHAASVEAFLRWLGEHSTEARDWHLLFVGHKGWKEGKLRERMRNSLFNDRIHVVRNPKSEDLPALYSLASIFVYPSFYEGFGFPPLEAMACGVPVIVGANSSLGEIVSGAGLLVNPYRVDEIIFAIRSLVLNARLAKSLRAKGLARTVNFSWDKTAMETLKIIESV